MNVETFFNHWGLDENPFKAEEAKDDPVYMRIMDSEMNHPDFEKIYGSPTHPSTAVVFGEKGSGKTAIRMLLEKRLVDYNTSNPERKVWLVKKDDLNPFIDSILHAIGTTEASPENLQRIRLEDHMVCWPIVQAEFIDRVFQQFSAEIFVLAETEVEPNIAKEFVDIPPVRRLQVKSELLLGLDIRRALKIPSGIERS